MNHEGIKCFVVGSIGFLNIEIYIMRNISFVVLNYNKYCLSIKYICDSIVKQPKMRKVLKKSRNNELIFILYFVFLQILIVYYNIKQN